jgi:hypothetical protein
MSWDDRMAVDLGVSAASDVEKAVPDADWTRDRRVPGWVRRTAFHLGVIALFTVPSIALWWRAWAGGPASTIRCGCLDPGQQVWFIAWPAYALSHGLNPFFTDWLWPPHGVNLLANASAPLTGLVLSPITWLFGPFVATTVALTLAPGLSAWGCWLACRRIVTWQPACWIASFLFGYSPEVVQNLAQGHLSVGLLVIPPLVFVVLHEMLVRQERSPTWCGITLGVLVSLQFLISAEVLTITVLVAASGIVITALLFRHQVATALPFALRAIAIAAFTSAVLLAVPVWEMLRGPEHIKGAIWSGLQGLFVARAYSLLNPGPYRDILWPGTLGGPTGEFLGFGMIGLFILSLAVARRKRGAWALAGVAVVATVLSWGSLLWLSPHHYIITRWLPWGHFLNLPVFENISPKNFATIADLGVVLVIAVGLDTLRWSSLGKRLHTAGRSVAMVAVVAVATLPIWLTYAAPFTVQTVKLPPWYTTAARHVPEGSVVTSVPFPASDALMSAPMVWQSADGMRFRLAGGYVKVPAADGKQGVIGLGPPDSATRILEQLTYDYSEVRPTAAGLAGLRAGLRAWGTSYIVVVDTGDAVGAAAVLTAATGQLPELSHRAWVWDLDSHPLGIAYDAQAANGAFATCTHNDADLGDVVASKPLPQYLNRCIVSPT